MRGKRDPNILVCLDFTVVLKENLFLLMLLFL